MDAVEKRPRRQRRNGQRKSDVRDGTPPEAAVDPRGASAGRNDKGPQRLRKMAHTGDDAPQSPPDSPRGEPLIFAPQDRVRQNLDDTAGLEPPGPSALTYNGPLPRPEEFSAGMESFAELGLTGCLQTCCRELGMLKPTPVQQYCIPQILKGKDVLGLAETGSGKTAAFALPMLHMLAENPYGIFSLVMTPTRELAFQICDQFKALGSTLNLRCTVVVGGMDFTAQAQALMGRPHVVIATPGRMKDHLINDPDMPGYFSKAKFLVLDEADRLLDVGFESELRVVLRSLPANRQTLLFSATLTRNLESLHELSLERSYFYSGHQGLKTVASLKQQYIFVPAKTKDVYLVHLLASLEEQSIRSVIIFAGSCRTCHLLSLIMEELDFETTALHSMKLQQQRLMSLNRFKAGQVPILIATDVASRGLDIPTVDLVINYDIPRLAQDYVHRVGRTARAGRGGCAISLVTQYDVELVHEIESDLGKQLEEYETSEDAVLKRITEVYKAKRVASLKLLDSGFEEKVKARKELKRKVLVDSGLSASRRNKQKRNRH